MAHFAKFKGSVAVKNDFEKIMTQNNRLWRCLFFEKMVLLFRKILQLAIRRFFAAQIKKKQASILAEIIVLCVSPFLLDIFASKVAEK